MGERTCSSLQRGEEVVFWWDSPFHHKKIYHDGTVDEVIEGGVYVSYMVGYKEYTDLILFADMVAVANKEGEYRKFGAISGRCDLLRQE